MPHRRLPDHTRRVRHSTIVTLLWLHAVVLTAGGLLDAESRTGVLIAGGGLALAAGAAGWERLPMRVRLLACALGLAGSSALLSELWPGVPAQFHLFVMLAVLALYQDPLRSEEHTSELQSQSNLVCRLLLEKKNKNE